jgi:phosphoglycolate phosphatase
MKNILFDLDGTLTDPGKGITRCIQYAFEQLNLALPSMEEVAPYIGPPLQVIFASLLDTDDRSLIDKAVSLYRERFSTKGIFENVMYQGIDDVLSALKEKDKRLFLATSKLQIFAERVLDHFDVAQYFEGIFGSEPNGDLADKECLVKHVITTSGIIPEETAMVGDRKYDMEGAIKNNVLPVGVLWGFGSEEELTRAGAEHICSKPLDIMRVLL